MKTPSYCKSNAGCAFGTKTFYNKKTGKQEGKSVKAWYRFKMSDGLYVPEPMELATAPQDTTVSIATTPQINSTNNGVQGSSDGQANLATPSTSNTGTKPNAYLGSTPQP